MQSESIIKIENTSNVWFTDGYRKLSFTQGQIKLVELCNQKLKSKEAITFQELRRLWLHYVLSDKQVIEFSWLKEGDMTREEYIAHFDREDTYYLSYQVLNWCKMNIGALVLKGALIAIPVINIDESIIKSLENKHA